MWAIKCPLFPLEALYCALGVESFYIITAVNILWIPNALLWGFLKLKVFMLRLHSLALSTIYLKVIPLFIPLPLHLHLPLSISLSYTLISYHTIIISHIFPPSSYIECFTLPNLHYPSIFYLLLSKSNH